MAREDLARLGPRHCFARPGGSPKYIADLLGHSQVTLTMQTYAHVLADAKKEVASKMDAILNPVATSGENLKGKDRLN